MNQNLRRNSTYVVNILAIERLLAVTDVWQVLSEVGVAVYEFDDANSSQLSEVRHKHHLDFMVTEDLPM